MDIGLGKREDGSIMVMDYSLWDFINPVLTITSNKRKYYIVKMTRQVLGTWYYLLIDSDDKQSISPLCIMSKYVLDTARNTLFFKRHDIDTGTFGDNEDGVYVFTDQGRLLGAGTSCSERDLKEEQAQATMVFLNPDIRYNTRNADSSNILIITHGVSKVIDISTFKLTDINGKSVLTNGDVSIEFDDNGKPIITNPTIPKRQTSYVRGD